MFRAWIVGSRHHFSTMGSSTSSSFAILSRFFGSPESLARADRSAARIGFSFGLSWWLR